MDSERRRAAKGMRRLPPLDPLQRYTITEAAAYLRFSRRTLYRRIKLGYIEIVRDGGRRYIAGKEIARHSTTDAQRVSVHE
jgi:excisionase family DNA binding protein